MLSCLCCLCLGLTHLHRHSMRPAGLQAELVKVATEREDLAAKLTANEKVRDFLMGKLKDAETDVREADERRDQALAQVRCVVVVSRDAFPTALAHPTCLCTLPGCSQPRIAKSSPFWTITRVSSRRSPRSCARSAMMRWRS